MTDQLVMPADEFDAVKRVHGFVEAVKDLPGVTVGEVTVVSATVAETAAKLADLVEEILGRFTRTDSGHVCRVGQVQIRKWNDKLAQLRSGRPS